MDTVLSCKRAASRDIRRLCYDTGILFGSLCRLPQQVINFTRHCETSYPQKKDKITRTRTRLGSLTVQNILVSIAEASHVNFVDLMNNFPRGWKIRHYIILPTFFYTVGCMLEFGTIHVTIQDFNIYKECKKLMVEISVEERLRQLEAKPA